MTRKNASKTAARDRQAKLGGKYQSHLRQVQKSRDPNKERARETLCASCTPTYGYEPIQAEGRSLGGRCFGCGGHFEILGMFTVPHPDGGPSVPLTKEQLAKRHVVAEEDSFDAFTGDDDF
jgi:hypothetical protein